MPLTRRVFFIFLLALGQRISAQTDALGSWNILQLRYKTAAKWSVFAEAQLRSLGFYRDFHYHEAKGGVTYEALPGLALSLAAGDYDTYAEGGTFVRPKNNDEFRIWPQVALSQKIGRFRVEQRYRMELRFTSRGYRNRFRYRTALVFPWHKSPKGYFRWQLQASNELFFTDKEPYFERNRAALNLQYRLSRQVAVMLGYLHQFDYRINDETGRDFLQTGVYLDFQGK
jgi:uncharacterized protein YegP (UPF0339 family)